MNNIITIKVSFITIIFSTGVRGAQPAALCRRC